MGKVKREELELIKEMDDFYRKAGAKPVAMSFSPYEIEHLINLVQLGVESRRRWIIRENTRRDGSLRPLDIWEKHLILMDKLLLLKLSKAEREAFREVDSNDGREMPRVWRKGCS